MHTLYSRNEIETWDKLRLEWSPTKRGSSLDISEEVDIYDQQAPTVMISHLPSSAQSLFISGASELSKNLYQEDNMGNFRTDAIGLMAASGRPH